MEDIFLEYKNFPEIFKALSHPIRVKITAGLISNNECNVSKMVKYLNIPQPTVSQHLNILKSAKIIEGYRCGNQVCYKVINEDVKKIFSVLGGCK
jgi:DNA-binding transcriptional ArsR family regulator